MAAPYSGRGALPPLGPLAIALIVAAGLIAGGSRVGGQAFSLGEWSAVFNMPLVAVHAALLHTGDVLLFDAWEIPGTPSARVWNPSTNQYTAVPNGFAELFCAGHVLLEDGRLFTAGGHNGAGVGTTDVTTFDPVTRIWTQLPSLNYARWYPAVAQLTDGRIISMGGSISRPDVAEIPETFTLGGSAWTSLPAAQKDVGEYPSLLARANGRLFVADASQTYQSWLFDPASSAWTPLGQGPAGAGVAVTYRPGRVMMAGGGLAGADPVVPTTGVIDLNAASPAWRQTAPMAYGRAQHNLVILPDGRVLVVGGSTEVSLISTSGVRPAEIWDAETETWTTVASMATPRMYHSTALLLPDGRVLAAGGGRLAPAVDYLNGEFYSPPYLFRGTRPVIASAPASITHGSTFNVDAPDAPSIARVTLVRASSVTHTVNYDQRFIELTFQAGSGQLTVQAPSGPAAAPPGYYMLFVLDGNDVPSVGRLLRIAPAPSGPTLSITDASIVEGTGGSVSASFAVTLTGSSPQTVSVQYATADGTATAGSDYTATSGTLTFAPGTSTRTAVVPITTDAVVEPNETFTVSLSNPVNASIADGTAVGTIIDDDAPATPTLSIDSVSVTEGTGSGTPVAAFTVTLSPASAQDVIVEFRTVPGTAIAPDDYTHTAGTLTFAGGTTTQTIQVPIVPDALGEPDETFSVELFDPVNAVIGEAWGVGTIVNDDTVIQTFTIAAGPDDVNEEGTGFESGSGSVWLGTGGVTNASFLGLRFTNVAVPQGATIVAARLDVESASTQWVSVGFEYAADAAGNSQPLSAASRPSQRTLLPPRVAHSSDVQWLANNRYALDDITPIVQAVVNQTGWSAGNALSLVVRGTGDAWSRKFVTSFDGGASRAPRLIVTHANTGSPPPSMPTLAVDDVTLAEGNSGTRNAVFTVTLSTAPGTSTVTVSYATANGTAFAPGDYTATNGTLTFTGSTTTQTIAVPVVGDTAVEPDETFTVTLSGASGATIADGSGTGTIANDDTAPLPTISVGDVTVTETDIGTVDAAFVLTLSSASTQPVTVSYATADGTALAGSDFTAASGSVTFAVGATTQTVTVAVRSDVRDEQDEVFYLNLSSPVNATIADGQGQATILDNDPEPALSVADVTVNEGNGGAKNVTFTVRLSAASDKSITVTCATADGTATAGADYTAKTATLAFSPGTTSRAFTVAVKGDRIDEPNETFFVHLTNAVNASIARSPAVGTIVDND